MEKEIEELHNLFKQLSKHVFTVSNLWQVDKQLTAFNLKLLGPIHNQLVLLVFSQFP